MSTADEIESLESEVEFLKYVIEKMMKWSGHGYDELAEYFDCEVEDLR